MSEVMSRRSSAASFALTVIKPFWWLAKTAFVAVLGLVAPIVAFILGTAAVLLVLTAVIFRYGAPRLELPFWEMMAGALACAIARTLLDRVWTRLLG